jgi:hypothetical protein
MVVMDGHIELFDFFGIGSAPDIFTWLGVLGALYDQSLFSLLNGMAFINSVDQSGVYGHFMPKDSMAFGYRFHLAWGLCDFIHYSSQTFDVVQVRHRR